MHVQIKVVYLASIQLFLNSITSQMVSKLGNIFEDILDVTFLSAKKSTKSFSDTND